MRRSSRHVGAIALVAIAVAAAGCVNWTRESERTQAERLATPSRWGTPSVFTPARRTAGDAIRGHFGVRRPPVQPFAYSHQIHLDNGLMCTDCHEGVERGPRAGIPGINTCMICHSQIATERPLIQTLADMQAKGLDLAWQRVYDYPPQAHVRFEHAPHIRAKVDCATCHGDMRQQSVAQRMVDMDMGFCVNCHKQRQASNDCLTCHY